MELTVRVNGGAVADPNRLVNQATASGTDPYGNNVEDDSDNGNDPNGGDDPTPVFLPCFVEIICPVTADPIVTEMDTDWCAALVTFPDATLESDCMNVTGMSIQYILSQDATDASDATVAGGTWVTGQPSGLRFNEDTTTVTFRIDPASIPAGSVIDPGTCDFDIVVIDKQPPSVICRDIDIELDANGIVSITPADIDGGTTDNCDVPTLTIDIPAFSCADLGNNNVTLTATDSEGNSSSCVSTVVIMDNMNPVSYTHLTLPTICSV